MIKRIYIKVLALALVLAFFCGNYTIVVRQKTVLNYVDILNAREDVYGASVDIKPIMVGGQVQHILPQVLQGA